MMERCRFPEPQVESVVGVMMVTRRMKDPDKRRAEIIQAARTLFTQKGVEATSVSEIVRSLGVAQGTFYWYFPSKEELVHSVVEAMGEEICAKMEVVPETEGLNALEKAASLLRIFISGVALGQRPFQYFHRSELRPIHDDLMRAINRRLRPVLARVIEQGNSEGFFRAAFPDETAACLLATITAFHDDPAVIQDGPKGRAIVALISFIMNGLGGRVDIDDFIAGAFRGNDFQPK